MPYDLSVGRPDILEAEIPPIPHTPLIPLPKEDWESFMTTGEFVAHRQQSQITFVLLLQIPPFVRAGQLVGHHQVKSAV